MSAEILSFPAALATAAPVALPVGLPPLHTRRPFAPRRREYDLEEVIELCGLGALTRRVAIDHLRDLAAEFGMPLPKNPRRHRGRVQPGALAIGARSRWCALLFDAWLDRPGPAGPASSSSHAVGQHKATPASPATREAMSQRARQLAAGGA